MFWNRPKVEFLCMDETLQHLYPIAEARKVYPTWFKEETTAYANNLLKARDVDATRNIVKCRGIRKLLNTGWVARAWQDIKIKVYSDGNFIWATPIDQKQFNGCANKELVTFHDADTFSKCPSISKNIPILKIQLPWVIKVPEGYNMMQLPIAYGDEDRFFAASGVYESAFGLMEVNIQLLWQTGVGEYLIKAGTPLAQFILVKDEKPVTVVRTITPSENKLLIAELNTKQITFCTHYASMKNNLKQILKRK